MQWPANDAILSLGDRECFKDFYRFHSVKTAINSHSTAYNFCNKKCINLKPTEAQHISKHFISLPPVRAKCEMLQSTFTSVMISSSTICQTLICSLFQYVCFDACRNWCIGVSAMEHIGANHSSCCWSNSASGAALKSASRFAQLYRKENKPKCPFEWERWKAIQNESM